jgi:hypothetical protein
MLFVRVGCEICPKCKKQSGWQEAPDQGIPNPNDEKEVAIKVAGETWFIGFYKERWGEWKNICRGRSFWVCEECGFRWDKIFPVAAIQKEWDPNEKSV